MESPTPVIRKMYHPDLNAVGDTTAEGFEMIYRGRGWQLMDPASEVATQAVGRPVLALKDLTTDELRQVLGAQGVEQPAQNTKKNVLVKMVAAVAGGQSLDESTAVDDGSDDEVSDTSNSSTASTSKSEDGQSKDQPSGVAKKAAANKRS